MSTCLPFYGSQRSQHLLLRPWTMSKMRRERRQSQHGQKTFPPLRFLLQPIYFHKLRGCPERHQSLQGDIIHSQRANVRWRRNNPNRGGQRNEKGDLMWSSARAAHALLAGLLTFLLPLSPASAQKYRQPVDAVALDTFNVTGNGGQ